MPDSYTSSSYGLCTTPCTWPLLLSPHYSKSEHSFWPKSVYFKSPTTTTHCNEVRNGQTSVIQDFKYWRGTFSQCVADLVVRNIGRTNNQNNHNEVSKRTTVQPLPPLNSERMQELMCHDRTVPCMLQVRRLDRVPEERPMNMHYFPPSYN